MLKKKTDEVYIQTADPVSFDSSAITFLKEKALSNERRRARICAHNSNSDALHEMLIAIGRDSYIRPHRHHNKTESFHLIEGSADIVLFSENGSIEDVIKLAPNANFYYRLDAPRYHTLIIASPLLVIHEITSGPFDSNLTDYAAFSPPEGSIEGVDFMAKLRQSVNQFYLEH